MTSGFPALSAHVLVEPERRLPRVAARARGVLAGALRPRPHDAPGRPRPGPPSTAELDERRSGAPARATMGCRSRQPSSRWSGASSPSRRGDGPARRQDRDRHGRLERDRRRDRARASRAEGVRVAGGARRVERLADATIALELDVTDPASCERFVDARGRAARRASTSSSTTPASRSAATRSTESTEEDEEHGLRDERPRAHADDAALPAAHPRRRPHRQHRLDRRPPGVRERRVVRRVEVRGARLHLRAARGSARPADPDHDRRRRPRRDGVLARPLPGRRREGGRRSTRASTR